MVNKIVNKIVNETVNKNVNKTVNETVNKNVNKNVNKIVNKNVNKIVNKNVNKMVNKIDIVIARYNENLDWLKDIPKNINIIVYNKGLEDITCPYIKLENIGRESHTYLYHIITNYDNLADITIFCQGDSIFHSPDFLKLLKNVQYFEPLQPLSAFYWPEGKEPFYISNPPKPILNATKNLHIKDCRIHVEYLDNNFETQYPYYYHDPNYNRFINKNKETYKTSNVLEFNINRFFLKNMDKNKLFPICYSGLFSVNKEVIRENSIDFYNNIKNVLLYDVRDGHEKKAMDHGQLLEKLWLVIFNYKKNNKNYIDLNCNDYINYESNLIIKNNTINFKLYIISCNINLEFYINNLLFVLIIDRRFIILKFYNKENKGILLYIDDIIFKKNLKNVLKDMSELAIMILFKINSISLHINNILFFNVILKYPINTINTVDKGKIILLSKDNKLIDNNA